MSSSRFQLKGFYVLILWLMQTCANAQAVDTLAAPPTNLLRSSVAKEFRGGLQEKYLHYIAAKLGMPLDIFPMPLARRIHALKKGEIDIMVGMREGYDTEDKFIYLEPSYETLKVSYFVLVSNQDILISEADFEGLNLGLTVHDSTKLDVFTKQGINVFPINSLSQKIIMLKNGRIDAFRHFDDITEAKLLEMGLTGQVVHAKYQEDKGYRYFVAISKTSPLFNKQAQIRDIINDAITTNAFKKLRLAHYRTLEMEAEAKD